jgi:hypothetical protein
MDHLPRPKSVPYNSEKFDIKCYATRNYDGLDFRSYPERCGWVARTSADWDTVIHPAQDDFQGLLQTWLYFGVAQSFFQRPVAIEDLTKSQLNDSGELYLDSTPLLALVQGWLSDLDSFSNSDYMTVSDYITEARFVHEELRADSRAGCESESCQLVTFVEYLQNRPGGLDPRESMMTEAQTALFDLIDGALARAKEIEKASVEDILSPPFYSDQDQGGSSYEGSSIWNLMCQDGWCPSELVMIFGSFSVAGIYFLSHLERPNQDHIHQAEPQEPPIDSGTELLTHKPLCSRRHCSLYQLDQDSYQTKHTTECLGCDEMRVLNDELLAILGRHQIPIVTAIGDTERQTTIKLQHYVEGKPYVAISHVWADGLGNLDRNGIPRCQMLRLSAYARELLPSEGDFYFWLDTLCCPPDSMNRPVEQNIALDLMRDTYSKSHITIVLDKWLQTHHLCTDPIIDSLFKVICSPWTRRLWTLQEGALAQRILVKGLDGFFDVDHAISMIIQPTSNVELLNVRADIVHRWYTIRGFKDLDEVELFYALYSSLAFRTTSVFEDEPLCLATLFRLPVAVIAEQKTHEERMLKFWSMFRELPAEIMDHYETRLQIPGFRWAPRSFMTDDENFFPYSNKMIQHGHLEQAIRTDEGLQVTASGFSVHIKDASLTGPIFVKHPAGFWAKCTFRFDLDAIELLNTLDTSSDQNNIPVIGFSPQTSHQAQNIAMLYHNWGHLEKWQEAKGDASRITGSLASITGFHGKRIIVRRFGLFALAPVAQTDSIIAVLERALRSGIDAGCELNDIVLVENSSGSVIAGVLQKLPERQTWLLD